MANYLFTDVLMDTDEIPNSQPISLSSPNLSGECLATDSDKIFNYNDSEAAVTITPHTIKVRPVPRTGQKGDFRSVEEIDNKYRGVFSYQYFNLVQSQVIDDALYSDKSMVVCAPTGSGKTVVFEMAVVQLLMELEDKCYTDDFKIIYMAPVKSLCNERLTEWYSKFTKLGLLCIEVTGDTDVDFSQLKPYRVIITTPEKWDMLTRRWRDHRSLVEVIKLFLIDEVHILNDEIRGPVLEAVVSRMKTIESSSQSTHRIESLQQQYMGNPTTTVVGPPPRIRFVAVSATVNNPEDVAAWLGNGERPAVFYKFGDECRPVKLRRVVEGYPCPDGTSIFKFDIILNYKLWPIIQKYHNGKPTLIFCNTRKSVALTADALSRELTITFTPEQKARLTALASAIKNRKLQQLVLSGVGCHHAGLLYEERLNIEQAFRNMDLPILITTTTLAMGVNLPAHLVIVKNTQQYVNGAYQEYSMSTVLQMVGRAGRPQFDTEATAVIMTRFADKHRYQALVGGCEPLQSYLHRRLAENLNSEAALGTVCDVAQCVQWLRSTFLYARANKDPKWYLGLPREAPRDLITKKIEELCVKAMNGLATAGLITMDDASCIESTQAGRLMSLYYLDLETMKHIMKIEGTESLERLLYLLCECHELSDVHLRMDEKRCLNALNRNNAAATIRYPMKGKIASRQMKVNCMIQAILGCLPIPDPALNQEAMKIMRIADRVCKCLVAYVTRSELVSKQPQIHSAVLNSLILAKCVVAHLWENSPYVSKQLKGIGPTFSTLLATAGKVNFLLLEESHPRDLERVMNKGAPAGNVLRKQIGLLPKYQVTATPLDERRVSVRLDLLNMAHLMENMEHLTAGETHKSYVVVGDSENYLLLLTSFVDKDLMGVYEGSMTYEITRKHNFEHKVIIHCLSSKFVGIDAQTEYIFKDLGQPFIRGEVTSHKVKDTATKTTTKKQTTITDVFKERKRKNTDDISQSKEKMKRECTLIDKFKWLRDSFGAASKEIKESVAKSSEASNTLLQDLIKDESGNDTPNTQIHHQLNYAVAEKDSEIAKIHEYVDMSYDNIDEMAQEEPFIIDERIDRILNDIENEISMNSNNSGPKADMSVFDTDISKGFTKGQMVRDVTTEIDDKYKSRTSNKTVNCTSNSRINGTRKRKLARSNYSCVDKLKMQDSKTDAKDTVTFDDNKNWINTIREQIKKFINDAPTSNNIDNVVTNLVDNAQSQEIKTTKGIMQIDNGNIHIHPSTQYINEMNPFTNIGNEAVLKNKDKKELSLLNDNLLLEHKISNPNEFASIKQSTVTSQKLEVNTSILNEHKTPGRDFSVPKANSDIDMEITNLSETDNIGEFKVYEVPYLEESLPPVNLFKMPRVLSPADNVAKQTSTENRTEGPNFNYPVQSNKSNFNGCDYNSIQTKIPDCDCALSKANSDIYIKINNSNKTDNYRKLIETPTYKVPNLAVMILSGLDKENTASDKLESNNEHYNYNNMIDLFDSNKARALCSTQSYGNKTNDTDPSCNNPQRSKHNNIKQNVINSPLTDNPKLSKLNSLTHSSKIVPYKPSLSNYPLEFDSSPINKDIFNHFDHYLDHKIDNIPIRNIDNTPKELVTRSEHCVISSNSKYRHRPNEGFVVNNNGDICNTPKERVTCTEYFVTSSNPKYYDRPNDRFNDNDNNNADRSKYINKYHFTTTQIGVSTKTLPEHDLKIIRKVDIDVNVTEIITKRKNIYLNNYCTNEQMKSTLDIGTTNTKKLNELPIPDFKTDNALHRYTELKHVTIETNQAIIPKHENMDTVPLIQEVRTHNPIEAKADDENERDNNCNDTFTEAFIQSSAKQADTVTNILNKYSQIMRESNIIQGSTSTSGEMRNSTNHSISKNVTATNRYTTGKKCSKRPYKISDLNDLQILLPKSLVGDEKATAEAMISHADIISRVKKIEPENDEVNNFSPLPNLETSFQAENVNDDLQLNLSPEQLSPLNISDMALNEIDQTMLNPKTLLQCFSTEENLLLPPPPEFSDNIISYSPTGDVEDLYNPVSCLDVDGMEEVLPWTKKDNFENTSRNTTLTPSKEIETWTLSVEGDTPTRERFYSNPFKSCTVMRSTSSGIQNDANFIYGRPNLKSFKYKSKNKLKM